MASGDVRFAVWAPYHQVVAAHLVAPLERVVPLERDSQGLHSRVVPGVPPGARYLFQLTDFERPDPASRHQPEGVHGPSEILEPTFEWTDAAFRSGPLHDAVLYELHVGTFTGEGTFDSAIRRLPELAALGVTHVEVMPVAEFAGARNWGYDGVYPHAVHAGYGGPSGFKRFVDACHGLGLGVCLDVVYNHLGPEGNYTGDFGPYFTSRCETPWGSALNFDGPGSDWVREFFIQSAESFLDEFHVDGFRLDAVHAIVDGSARPFLEELAERIQRLGDSLGRRVFVIAESDLNDVRLLRAREVGGYGMDAQWSDDFHHAIHAAVTGERAGYYQDFGAIDHVARAFERGYVYSGQYSKFRGRRHGNDPSAFSGERFVACTQNHDQVGNRAKGDRLGERLTFDEQKVLACLLLLSPFVPLLFMGQEFGETAPFLYFTSFSDTQLADAVREGRRAELSAFGWDPAAAPDPNDAETFVRSKLGSLEAQGPSGRWLWELHRKLIEIRKAREALIGKDLRFVRARCDEAGRVLVLERASRGDRVLAGFGFGLGGSGDVTLPRSETGWTRLLDTRAPEYGGAGGDAPDGTQPADTVSIRIRGAACVVYATA